MSDSVERARGRLGRILGAEIVDVRRRHGSWFVRLASDGREIELGNDRDVRDRVRLSARLLLSGVVGPPVSANNAREAWVLMRALKGRPREGGRIG